MTEWKLNPEYGSEVIMFVAEDALVEHWKTNDGCSIFKSTYKPTNEVFFCRTPSDAMSCVDTFRKYHKLLTGDNDVTPTTKGLYDYNEHPHPQGLG